MIPYLGGGWGVTAAGGKSFHLAPGPRLRRGLALGLYSLAVLAALAGAARLQCACYRYQVQVWGD